MQWAQDLQAGALDPIVWGRKASRLADCTRFGLSVPPGLAITRGAESERILDETALADLIQPWLTVNNPRAVILRASEISEDGDETAAAGLSLSVADVPATAAIVSQTLVESGILLGEGSVVIQSQLQASWFGVLMTIGGGWRIEMSKSHQAVTSGDAIDAWLETDGDQYDAGGACIAGAPILSLAINSKLLVDRLMPPFGRHLDVEWAWSHGTMSLLQVRPLTVQL